MPACPNFDRCTLRQSLGMQAALAVWQSFYCDGCFARCERFKLLGAGQDVPSRLLPNGRLLDGPEGMPAAPGSSTRAA
ncbi:MAG TPA: hypothetical protein VML50_16180 [Anaeromyxobacter sp.]|nr:hypothetical protein [Anaeromyxobacter sp.]